MKKFTLLAFVVFTSGLAQADQISISGDRCVQEIEGIKKNLLLKVKKQESSFPEFEYSVFDFFVQGTSVQVVPQVLVDGAESDSVSIPERRLIQVSRSRWCPSDEKSKALLLFHDYLVQMRLESSENYKISARLEYGASGKGLIWSCSVNLMRGDGQTTTCEESATDLDAAWGKIQRNCWDIDVYGPEECADMNGNAIPCETQTKLYYSWHACSEMSRSFWGSDECVRRPTRTESCLQIENTPSNRCVIISGGMICP